MARELFRIAANGEHCQRPGAIWAFGNAELGHVLFGFQSQKVMRSECCWRCYDEREKIEGVDGVTIGNTFFPTHGMILCKVCGNKRCPKATDHRNDCTNSNDPGQPGSCY